MLSGVGISRVELSQRLPLRPLLINTETVSTMRTLQLERAQKGKIVEIAMLSNLLN